MIPHWRVWTPHRWMRRYKDRGG